MSNPVSTLRLQDAWRECERNAYHLQRALGQLQSILPLNAEQFLRLTDAQIQTLDQFILRFTKLQDAMGSHLYPLFLTTCKSRWKSVPCLTSSTA